MRPADPGQLRSAWLSSGRSDQLRSAKTTSVGCKIGSRFASVLATALFAKPTISRDYRPDASRTLPANSPVMRGRSRTPHDVHAASKPASAGSLMSVLGGWSSTRLLPIRVAWRYARNSAYDALNCGELPALRIDKRLLVPRPGSARAPRRCGAGRRPVSRRRSRTGAAMSTVDAPLVAPERSPAKLEPASELFPGA
jgi:hypothetical protein